MGGNWGGRVENCGEGGVTPKRHTPSPHHPVNQGGGSACEKGLFNRNAMLEKDVTVFIVGEKRSRTIHSNRASLNGGMAPKGARHRSSWNTRTDFTKPMSGKGVRPRGRTGKDCEPGEMGVAASGTPKNGMRGGERSAGGRRTKLRKRHGKRTNLAQQRRKIGGDKWDVLSPRFGEEEVIYF